jgi:hypothetical protein
MKRIGKAVIKRLYMYTDQFGLTLSYEEEIKNVQ